MTSMENPTDGGSGNGRDKNEQLRRPNEALPRTHPNPEEPHPAHRDQVPPRPIDTHEHREPVQQEPVGHGPARHDLAYRQEPHHDSAMFPQIPLAVHTSTEPIHLPRGYTEGTSFTRQRSLAGTHISDSVAESAAFGAGLIGSVAKVGGYVLAIPIVGALLGGKWVIDKIGDGLKNFLTSMITKEGVWKILTGWMKGGKDAHGGEHEKKPEAAPTKPTAKSGGSSSPKPEAHPH